MLARRARRRMAPCLLLLLCAGSPAFADENFSYTNAEIAYATHGDSGAASHDALSLGGSFAFAEHLFVFGSLLAIKHDTGAGLTTAATNLGLGVHWGLAPAVDAVAGVSSNLQVVFQDSYPYSEFGSGSARHDGVEIHAGLRGHVGRFLELTGGVKYSDFGHGVQDYIWTAGGRVYFTRALAAGVDMSDSDDGTVWRFALRYDFGRFD